nr:cold shock domain-containing protein 3-like [Tanacetum cinerariifolium]
GGEELFFHQTNIKSSSTDGIWSPKEGDIVEYVIAKGNYGKVKASDVTCYGGFDVTGHDGGTRGNGVYNPDEPENYCFRCCENGHRARDCVAEILSEEKYTFKTVYSLAELDRVY